jgi:hypothetical protein
MKSAALGRSTSPVEVTNVSPHGFWLFVGDQELFVPFKDFPWSRRPRFGRSAASNYRVRITCTGRASISILPSSH